MAFPIFQYLLIKLAARCNLDCTYCYWFRDEGVYAKPPILTIDTEEALLKKLEAHINEFGLTKFSLLFHGGEPLLFGKERFVNLVCKLREIERRTKCIFSLSMTTNAVLIDKEWAQWLRVLNISITVSIDGPRDLHDKYRVDFKGRGSFDRVMRGIYLLREFGIEPGILAVCNPESDPETVTQYFVDTLAFKHFDILVPDATHENSPPSIAAYYKKLFNLWYDDYSHRGIEVRYSKGMLTGLLGKEAHLESVGYGPIQTVTVLTDGSLEPLDVLRIAGKNSTQTNLSIQTHTFQDMTSNPIWLSAYNSSLNLCPQCNSCEYLQACGGGYLPHRWSSVNGYNNPSVYCNDLKEIFTHIWSRVSPEIHITRQDGDVISLYDAVNALG